MTWNTAMCKLQFHMTHPLGNICCIIWEGQIFSDRLSTTWKWCWPLNIMIMWPDSISWFIFKLCPKLVQHTQISKLLVTFNAYFFLWLVAEVYPLFLTIKIHLIAWRVKRTIKKWCFSLMMQLPQVEGVVSWKQPLSGCARNLYTDSTDQRSCQWQTW